MGEVPALLGCGCEDVRGAHGATAFGPGPAVDAEQGPHRQADSRRIQQVLSCEVVVGAVIFPEVVLDLIECIWADIGVVSSVQLFADAVEHPLAMCDQLAHVACLG